MGLVRFPHQRYASLELNQVAFPKTGMVVSQTPLGSEFTASAPCENGMWLLADKAKGTLGSATDVTAKPYGIVYTAEKNYNVSEQGLKNFCQVEGDYPRVGILGLGDTVTTNCLQYDNTETGFTTAEALETTLNAYATTAVYVIAVASDPVPKLTKTLTSYNGPVGKVTKYYTLPNGEKAVKYEMIKI